MAIRVVTQSVEWLKRLVLTWVVALWGVLKGLLPCFRDLAELRC